jgi:hypothetical protein
MPIRKQLPINIQIHQTEIDLRLQHCFIFNVMHHRGFTLLVAASVSMFSSMLIYLLT